MSKSKTQICPYCGERHRIWADRAAHPECYRAHRRIYYHEVLKPRKDAPQPPPLPDGHKRCPKCKRVLPRERFHRCRSKRDGRESWCKDCVYFHKKRPTDKRTKAYRIMRSKRNAYMRSWRALNREHSNAYQREYHKRWRWRRVLAKHGVMT